MATNVSICNLALVRVGVGPDGYIDSLEEETTEGMACDALFEHCRDTLLSSFDWNFARRRQTLALLEDVEREGWEYAYALPSDVLVPLRITGAERTPDAASRVPFAVEANDSGDGQVLVTDFEEVELVYTAKITSQAIVNPLFYDTLAWLLASELAMTIPNKADYRAQAVTRYEQQLSRAMALDLAQGHESEPDGQLIKARV